MKEIYKKHENDAKNVCMWAQRNPNILFYYQETRSEVGGELSRSNIPFIIKIQTPWQATMMQQYGHQSVVAINVTFET
jgi:hypothetical protein